MCFICIYLVLIIWYFYNIYIYFFKYFACLYFLARKYYLLRLAPIFTVHTHPFLRILRMPLAWMEH